MKKGEPSVSSEGVDLQWDFETLWCVALPPPTDLLDGIKKKYIEGQDGNKIVFSETIVVRSSFKWWVPKHDRLISGRTPSLTWMLL